MDIILEVDNNVSILIESTPIYISVESVTSELSGLDVDSNYLIETNEINSTSILIEPIEYSITLDTIETITSPEYEWIDYIVGWTSTPTYQASITGGSVFLYNMDMGNVYRFVPDPYNSLNDAFYSDFNGSSLSNFLVSRG